MLEKTKLNQKGFSGVLVILLVLVLLGGGLYYAASSGMFKPSGPSASPPPSKPVENNTPKEASIKVEYEYTVKSVTPKFITLKGLKTDFLLPNDPSKVKVYKGADDTAPEAALSELKEGDKLNMEYVAGKSAKLYML